MRRIASTPPLLFLALLSACSSEKAAPKGAEAVPVTVGTAEKRAMPVEVTAIGHVEALSTVSVKARVGGEITRVFFKEGDEVKAGDMLFQIDPRPLAAALHEAEANLERDRVKAQNAAQDVARYAELVKKDFVTREQYDQTAANADSLRATLKADEAAVETTRLQLDYAAIRAPITGRTGSVLVHAGNVIKANEDKPMLVIHEIRPINAVFAVPESTLPEIKGQMGGGALKVTATPAGSARGYEGTLSFLDNAVDAATGTVTLKATFPNADSALWPGQFVNVALTLRNEPDAIVVPSEAVQTGQSGSYVFVVKDDLTVESRPVVVARTAARLAVVAKGLAAGERVVTDGQLRLAPGSKVEIKEG